MRTAPDQYVSESVVYIATDRLYAGRLRAYGGYNYMPNIEKLVKYGTKYNNATATAGSTLMTHSAEWTGKYTADLHGDLAHKDRLYNTEMPKQDTVFSDFIERGFNVYVVLVHKRPGKTYDSFRPVFNLWPEEARIVKIPDWDIKGGEKLRRKDSVSSYFPEEDFLVQTDCVSCRNLRLLRIDRPICTICEKNYDLGGVCD